MLYLCVLELCVLGRTGGRGLSLCGVCRICGERCGGHRGRDCVRVFLCRRGCGLFGYSLCAGSIRGGFVRSRGGAARFSRANGRNIGGKARRVLRKRNRGRGGGHGKAGQ